jgi:hypothetical protein
VDGALHGRPRLNRVEAVAPGQRDVDAGDVDSQRALERVDDERERRDTRVGGRVRQQERRELFCFQVEGFERDRAPEAHLDLAAV